MDHSKIDAVVILGGGLKKDKNGWRTTRFSDAVAGGEPADAFGDRLRVVAGYFLYRNELRENQDSVILVSGGCGRFKKVKGVPVVAEVLKKELVVLGVPKNKILEEKKSNNTYQQLKILSGLILKNKWKKIRIISNQYHLPRVEALIENSVDLKFLEHRLKAKKIFLISAEDVLLRYDKKGWGNSISRAYKSEWMKNRIILEKQGIKRLKAGLYKLQ